MPARSYEQACSLAGALDVVGGRWTLLILRDLLGGAARFVDLQRGLPGIASNLLSERLAHLERHGLVERVTGPFDAALYRVTLLGEQSRPALEALAKFGLTLPRKGPAPGEDRPAHVRYLATALQGVLQGALPARKPLHVALELEDEWLVVRVNESDATVRYEHPPDDVAVISVPYELLRDILGYGKAASRLSGGAEVSSGDPELLGSFAEMLGEAMAALATASR